MADKETARHFMQAWAESAAMSDSKATTAEPVAWMVWQPMGGPARFTTDAKGVADLQSRADMTVTPLYAHPPAAPEPVEVIDPWVMDLVRKHGATMTNSEIVHGVADDKGTYIYVPEGLQEYPNLQAMMEGRVSGKTSEWPMLRIEFSKFSVKAAALLQSRDATIERLRAELASIKKDAETNQKWAFLEWRQRALTAEAALATRQGE